MWLNVQVMEVSEVGNGEEIFEKDKGQSFCKCDENDQ